MRPLTYQFGDLRVDLMPSALSTMLAHQQKGFLRKEAGGQMFATLSEAHWRIEVVTGPRRGDRRGAYHFWPDRHAEQEEINRYYEQGLEFVGDWHTHPQNIPRPSAQDFTSTESILRESQHSLPGILMCIVGRDSPPDGLWMSFHPVSGGMVRYETPVKPEQQTRRRKVRWI
ncbi:Mov34/MPN/PAD-1 family protein [uncultured Agrobacterium sp.]|uniref:Mov34/MPN/PAD-1 family protein n=1 Tax=uncultured Agrobacterium sp. TaxID=157277 RepID=UPI0025F60BF7|nr:Mov34/MPN/PAD-1 family protein [uncultured Agrobacterium sp.]